jgi:regulator of sigma E protease
MMGNAPAWLMVVAFLCALGPLIFFHELGHYLVGRWFGVGAETFSIGFGREIFGWTDKRGTRWKIGWLPLGGYVRFVGDMNPASAPADPNEVPPELRARSFHCKPVWQRFLIVLAGPLANFLLAILIFVGFFAFVGTPQTNVVGKVLPDSAAASAGIRPGDRIVSVAGRSTPGFGDILNVVMIRPAETVTVSVERQQVRKDIRVTLGTDTLRDGTREFKRGLLGVYPSNDVHQPVPLTRAVPMAVDYTARLTQTMVDGLVQLIRGRVSPKQLGGPLKIAQVAGEGASQGWLPFVALVALISINLGFINLLPVPMLDGGHLLFYAIEAVRRRPVSPQTLDWAFRGGLAALLALFLFTTVNDLESFGLWERLGRLIG